VHTTFTTGIGALNGLTAASQFFATGTSGTDFNISSATATHTFNLPTASATNRGALSSADWTAFNNKGSVSSVATNNATGITGGTITTTGTLAIDTTVISTRLWRQKGIDSVQSNLTAGLALKVNISDTASMLLPYLRKVDTASLSNRINLKVNISDTASMLLPYLRKVDTASLSNRINLKVNISDTASMLSPYLRKVDTASLSNRINTKLNISDTATMLGNYVNNVGYGLTKASQVVSADSATLSAYYLRRKDSLTSTNLLGYVTRTVLADSAAAIRAAAGSGTISGSGTPNRVSKFTASGTIGNGSIVDSSSSVALTIAGSANIGVGVTPKSWATNWKAVQFNNASLATFTGLNEQVYLGLNWYADSGGDKYNANGAASTYVQSNGDHFWYTAPSGTAGNAITFTPRAYLYNDGRFAVGTTSSDSLFSVSQGAQFQRGVRMSGLPTGVGTKALRIDANGTLSVADTTSGGIGGSGTINRLAKFTASGTIGNGSIADSSSSVAMTIKSNQDIGIGTASPAYKLDVSGMTNSGAFITSATNGTGGQEALRIFNNNGYIGFFNTANTTRSAYIQGNTTDLTLATSLATPIIFAISNVEQMRFNASGNLGINTTTIGSKLQVNGNAAIGYSASTAAPTNGLVVAGTLLVGTTTAVSDNQLQIQINTTSGASRYFSANNNGDYGVILGYDVGLDGGSLRTIYAKPIAFGTTNTERMRLLAGGGLIIGNGETSATPSTGIISGTGGTGTNVAGAEFRIRGGASTGSGAGGPITFYTAAAGASGTTVRAATEVGRFTSAGDFGIGTTTPNSKLHVAGSVRLPITTKTTTYTLDATDYTVVFNLNGNATANLPDATTIPGRIYVIKINRTNVGDTLTIDPNGAQTIDGAATLAIQCQYAVTIQSDGTNWRIIGDYAQGINCL
jgi:hypothetical protein